MTDLGKAQGIRPRELFAIRPFRLLWTNSFLFILVQSTQRFAFVWLALELGAKSDISGLILFVMGIPVILISLIVGVMSDHADRRMLLLVSQDLCFGQVLTCPKITSADILTYPATYTKIYFSPSYMLF